MKKLLYLIFVIAVAMAFNGCQYDFFDSQEQVVTKEKTQKTIWVQSKDMLSNLETEQTDGVKIIVGSDEGALKSANSGPINFCRKTEFVHDANTVLTMGFRNAYETKGNEKVHQMSMLALELPEHIKIENIKSIQFARKEFDGTYDLYSSDWQKININKFNTIKDISRYTGEEVLKIEQSTVQDKWLIIKITFNQAYSENLIPYYFKSGGVWYQKYNPGVGEFDPDYN